MQQNNVFGKLRRESAFQQKRVRKRVRNKTCAQPHRMCKPERVAHIRNYKKQGKKRHCPADTI